MNATHDPILQRLRMISFSHTGALTDPASRTTEFSPGCVSASTPGPSVIARWLRVPQCSAPVTAWCAASLAIGFVLGCAMTWPDRNAVSNERTRLDQDQQAWANARTARGWEAARLANQRLRLQTDIHRLAEKATWLERSVEKLMAQREDLLAYEGALPRFRATDGTMYRIERWPPAIQGVSQHEFIWVRRLPNQ